LRWFADGQHFDTAIGKILGESADTELASFLLRGGAIKDALHSACNEATLSNGHGWQGKPTNP